MVATKSKEQNNEWFNTQKQWSELFKNWQSPASPEAYQQQWLDMFSQWQNIISTSSLETSSAPAFQEQFTKAGEDFMEMMQGFYQGVGQAKTMEEMTEEWIEKMYNFFSGEINGENNPMSNCNPMGLCTSIPGLGYNREKQDQTTDLYKKFMDYQKKSKIYDIKMAKVNMEALSKFQEYISNPPKDDAPLKSLKKVYGKWVDICEEVYAEYAMSEEYTKLYGETVNSLMAFKTKQNTMLDDMLEQMNMPTRKEVDTMHERMHKIRRENIELKKDIAEIKASLGLKKPKTKAKVKLKTKATKPKPVKKSLKKFAVKKTVKKSPKKILKKGKK